LKKKKEFDVQVKNLVYLCDINIFVMMTDEYDDDVMYLLSKAFLMHIFSRKKNKNNFKMFSV